MQIEIRARNHLDYNNQYEITIETEEGLTQEEYTTIKLAIEQIQNIMDWKIAETSSNRNQEAEAVTKED